MKKLIAILACTAVALPLAFAQDAHKSGAQKKAAPETEAPAEERAVIQRQAPLYPLDVCVISGEAFGPEGAVDVVHEGRLTRTCCKMCAKKVKANPAEIFAKIDAAVVAAQKPSYPLETCAVSGEELGSMGDPIDAVVDMRLVRLCCKGCKRGVEKKKDEVMAKLDAAYVAAQKASYPIGDCVVGGGELGSMGEPVEYLYGNRLVRFCCKGCIKGFEREPQKYLAKLDQVAPKKSGAK